MLDRTKAPPFRIKESYKLPKPEVKKLDNGNQVFTFPSAKTDVLRIEFIFRAGTWFEKKHGVSFFTIKSLLDGSTKRKAQEVARLIDFYGAFLDLDHGPDYSQLSLYAPTKNFSQLLPLIREMIYEPAFPEYELNIRKDRRIQLLKLEEKKYNVLATKKLKEVLFQANHPYGRRLTPQSVGDIQTEDLLEFQKDRASVGFDIILAGKWHQDHMKMINQLFGQSELMPRRATAFFPIDGEDEKDVVRISKPNSVQSSVRLGKISIKKSNEDFIKLLFTNVLLGGYFGSRLIKNIREEKGLTYGIYSSLVNLRNEAYIIISTEAKKELLHLTLAEIKKELAILGEKSIPQDEIILVKNYLTGHFLKGVNNAFSIADKFKSVYLYGLEYDYYERYFDTLNHITPDICGEMARKYLGPESFNEVVVG